MALFCWTSTTKADTHSTYHEIFWDLDTLGLVLAITELFQGKSPVFDQSNHADHLRNSCSLSWKVTLSAARVPLTGSDGTCISSLGCIFFFTHCLTSCLYFMHFTTSHRPWNIDWPWTANRALLLYFLPNQSVQREAATTRLIHNTSFVSALDVHNQITQCVVLKVIPHSYSTE